MSETDKALDAIVQESIEGLKPRVAAIVQEFAGLKLVGDARLGQNEVGLSYDGGKTLRHRFTLNTFDPTPHE